MRQSSIYFPSIWLALILAVTGSFLSVTTGHAQSNSLAINFSDQGFVIRCWGTEAGLPQNTVMTITQTRDGYLWLGTMAGLARFDGVRFKVFGLSDGLPSLQVRTLFEDANGNLWIGTVGGGLCRMRNGKIERVRGESVSGDETISSITADTNGRLWIGSTEGLLLWENDRLFRDEAFASLRRDFIRALLPGRNGSMWISAGSSLYLWQEGKLTAEAGPDPDLNISPYCLLEDRQGNIWASIGNGKVLCRQPDGVWKRYDQTLGLPFAYVTSLAEDAKGVVWAGSLDAGLYYFEAGRFHQLPAKAGLSDSAVRSLFPDREGNLWVGHRTSGLDRLTASKLVTLGADLGLTNDYVRTVAETSDGQLWLGTTGGGIYRTEAGRLLTLTNTTYNTYYPFVEAVVATRDGSIWWGGSGSLLHWRDGQIVEAFTATPQTWTPNSITLDWLFNTGASALLELDSGAGFWVGTTLGRVIRFENGQSQMLTNRFGRGAVTSFIQEPDGALWIGSLAGGLSRLQNGVVTFYSAKDGLHSSHIRALHRSADGVLWIGTGGGGLVRFKDGKFQSFGSQQGLGDDTVSQILEDDQGNLWLGCNRGIFRVRRMELEELADGHRKFVHPQAFGANAGMLAEECTGGSFPTACKLKSGKLAFATVKGVVIIDPRLQEFDSSPPAVVLEEVRADRNTLPLEYSTTTKGSEKSLIVTIPPGSRDCEFHYTGLSFRAPERVRFRFKLSDVDTDWVEADNRRVAYYNPLRPGSYKFHVTACNAAGIWSDQEAVLSVIVLPHFWETRWFRVLIGLTILGLLVGGATTLVRRRYKRRLAILELQNAVARERLRISQDMHDQIGGILTRVSILTDVGQDENEEPAVREQFERIGGNVRTAVQGLDEIVWATNPRNDNLPQFADYVGRFADEWFEGTKVRCWHDLPHDLPNLPLRADLRHNVFLAIKEACHNVLKHSGATEVWLRLTVKESRVAVEIEDNGHGFNPDKVSSGGNGLGNMTSRLEENGGRAFIMSAPGKGTIVRLTFLIMLPKQG